MTELQTELVQVSAAGAEPISLPDARLWLRLDTDDDVPLVSGLISAARDYAEKVCARSFKIGDQWRLTLNRFPFPLFSATPYWELPYSQLFPNGAAYSYRKPELFSIEIPMGPVAAINAITYFDATDTAQTLDPATYELIQSDDANPRLYPTFGKYWPGTAFRPDGVSILFTAGGVVPPTVILAMKQMIAHWYANREAITNSGAIPKEVPMTAEYLLWPNRLLEL